MRNDLMAEMGDTFHLDRHICGVRTDNKQMHNDNKLSFHLSGLNDPIKSLWYPPETETKLAILFTRRKV